MALLPFDASETPKPKKTATRMEKCLFGQQELDVPEIMMEDIRLFTDVMSQSTWENVLAESQRQHLMTFLPSFPENDEACKKETLELLFAGDTFKFCNPLKRFFKKMRDGIFLPDIVKYARLCRKAKEREYRYQQKLYYGRLLRELLVNRQRILDALYHLPPEERLTYDQSSFGEHHGRDQKTIEYRVQQKCHQLLAEVNEECGQGYVSSSSDGEDFGGPSASRSQSRWPQLKLQSSVDVSEYSMSAVRDTFAPKSRPEHHALKPTLHGPQVAGAKTKRPHRKMMVLDMTDENYQTMLLKHKRRKLEDANHPELNTQGIVLEDVIARVQMTRRTKPIGHKKKMKQPDSAADELADWQGLKGSKLLGSYSPETVEHYSGFQTIKQNVDDMEEPPSLLLRTALQRQTLPGCPPQFFSLLKQIICNEPEEKISLAKLDEKVREWHDSGSTTSRFFWGREQASWAEMIPSAVRFLSDGMLGLALENFSPMLDFKERLQQVHWIGHGCDSDAELATLYEYWLVNLSSESFDPSTGPSAIIPPPRMWTDYKVRPSTEKEKRAFQMQERERFRNPHKAFTYRMHGYESVVGPVKGILAKENMMKPREHSLLVKERPSFVTILTLVHDCAARLPNGEGTRNDVCELLKESQFLAPGVTDNQLNTVVSGALDRLHYGKDPCVKYDVTRKLWIYRHRSRAEDEFERIHRVQCMAAKAKKKALKKSKTEKSLTAAKKAAEKTTEAMRSSSTMASAGLENLVAQSSVEQFRSLDSISIPSVNSCSHSVLGPTASLPQLPFFAHSSVGSNVRAVGLLSSSYSVTDSAAVAAASQKLSLQSKGKPLTVSLVQQEARPGSLSSAAMPSIQHQLAAGSQNAAFGLINSQLRKAIDSNLAAVLVAPPGGSTAAMVRSVPASVPPRAAYSLSTARVSLPSAGSANIALSSASSASITFPSSVAPFSTVSKPVVARLMAQQRLPGVLALSGAMIRNVGAKPTMFMTASEGAVPSVTMSAATSAATVKPPYVVAAVVDPSESINVSTTAAVTGQQLAGLLRPVTAATSRLVHSVPSTVPSVQFISKPVQILQSSAASTPQLLSPLPATNQRSSSSAQVIVRTKSRQSETVSQILQQTAGDRTTPTRVPLPVSITDQIRPAAVQPGPPKLCAPKTPGNMRWISSLGQTRLVMPSDKGIVITQLPSESGMVRTQMFIQQRPVRSELIPQPTTAGVSPAVQPALLNPTAKLNASLQLVRALSNVSAQKLSAGSQPGTYVLSATQPTNETVQLHMASSVMSGTAKPAARQATAPVFARLLGPASGIRLAGILPNDVAAVQQQLANTKPLLTPVTSVASTTSADKTVPSTSG